MAFQNPRRRSVGADYFVVFVYDDDAALQGIHCGIEQGIFIGDQFYEVFELGLVHRFGLFYRLAHKLSHRNASFIFSDRFSMAACGDMLKMPTAVSASRIRAVILK